MKTLAVSDDVNWVQGFQAECDKYGFRVHTVSHLNKVPEAIRQFEADLIVIDTQEPEKVMTWWRNQSLFETKLLILVVETISEEIATAAIDSGAEDCLSKAAPHLLMAKFKALLRRHVRTSAGKRFISRLDLVIDPDRYEISLQGKQLALTLTEFKLLRELASSDDRVVPRTEIQARVFGRFNVSNRSLDVHICALRKKLKPFQLDIESIRGVGYRLRQFVKDVEITI